MMKSNRVQGSLSIGSCIVLNFSCMSRVRNTQHKAFTNPGASFCPQIIYCKVSTCPMMKIEPRTVFCPERIQRKVSTCSVVEIEPGTDFCPQRIQRNVSTYPVMKIELGSGFCPWSGIICLSASNFPCVCWWELMS